MSKTIDLRESTSSKKEMLMQKLNELRGVMGEEKFALLKNKILTN